MYSLNWGETRWITSHVKVKEHYHSNSLRRSQNSNENRDKANSPCALGEQIVASVDMNHAILEDTFPLVLNAGNLPRNIVSKLWVDRASKTGHTLSYVQNTMSESAPPVALVSLSLSESESSKSLLINSSSLTPPFAASEPAGCGKEGCIGRGA